MAAGLEFSPPSTHDKNADWSSDDEEEEGGLTIVQPDVLLDTHLETKADRQVLKLNCINVRSILHVSIDGVIWVLMSQV